MSNFQEQSLFTLNIPALPRYAQGWVQRFNDAMQGLVNRTKWLKDDLANKVDVADYNPYFKGVHSSLLALSTEHPTASAGSYALVDTGSESEADFYWFDLDDGWLTNGGMSIANTDVLVEGTTNLYFTTARAITAGATAFPRYDQVAVLIDADKSRFLANIGAKKSHNLINKTASYALQLADFQSAVDLYDIVYLRMNLATANNITFDTTLSSLPVLTEIDIRNAGAGFSTLVESGTVLNGIKTFNTVNEVKTVRKVGLNEWDIIGALS